MKPSGQILIILFLSHFCAGLRIKKYQVSNKVSSFDVIQTSASKSAGHCSLLCRTQMGCEGTKYENAECSTLKNIKLDGEDSVWVDVDQKTIKKTKLLITTGMISEDDQTTEIIDLKDPNNHCTTVPFPKPLQNTFNGLIGTDVPLICGGNGGPGALSTQCFTLWNKEYIETSFSLPKAYGALGHNLGVVLNGSLFKVGGGGGGPSAYAVSLNGIKQMKSAPRNLLHHCTVKVDEKSLMVLGGLDGKDRNKKTWILNIEENTWKPGLPLIDSRVSCACANFQLGSRNILVVSGGGTDSVEFLDLEANTGWVKGYSLSFKTIHSFGILQIFISGKSLPFQVSMHAMVTSPDGQGVLNIGGHGDRKELLLLECPTNDLNDCDWKILKQELKSPRKLMAAMLIPDSLADDLCN